MKIPDSISRLKSLKKINLNYNKLKFLPESICNMESLCELYIRSNTQIRLPEKIQNLVIRGLKIYI